MKSFRFDTPTLHWLIEPRGRGYALKRQRLERTAGVRSPLQPVGNWIPVDTFASAEEAAESVARGTTGILEWDRALAADRPAGLPAWRVEEMAHSAEPDAPRLSERFHAAWRRLRRRPA